MFGKKIRIHHLPGISRINAIVQMMTELEYSTSADCLRQANKRL